MSCREVQGEFILYFFDGDQMWGVKWLLEEFNSNGYVYKDSSIYYLSPKSQNKIPKYVSEYILDTYLSASWSMSHNFHHRFLALSSLYNYKRSLNT